MIIFAFYISIFFKDIYIVIQSMCTLLKIVCYIFCIFVLIFCLINMYTSLVKSLFMHHMNSYLMQSINLLQCNQILSSLIQEKLSCPDQYNRYLVIYIKLNSLTYNLLNYITINKLLTTTQVCKLCVCQVAGLIPSNSPTHQSD